MSFNRIARLLTKYPTQNCLSLAKKPLTRTLSTEIPPFNPIKQSSKKHDEKISNTVIVSGAIGISSFSFLLFANERKHHPGKIDPGHFTSHKL